MSTAVAKEASVMVLTAEVRVLMVGARQITMPVFNQLDVYKYDALEPMGRVNPRDDGPWIARWVIGRAVDGSLGRAQLPRHEYYERIHDELGELDARLRHHRYCLDRARDRRGSEVATRKEAIAEVEHQIANVQDAFMARRDEWAAHEQAIQAWAALPLIVLAGLR